MPFGLFPDVNIKPKLDPAPGARLLGLQTDQLIPVGTRRDYAVPLFADLD